MDENVVLGQFLLLPFAVGSLLWLFAQRRHRRTNRAGWPELVLGNLLVLLLLFSCALLAGEIYFRFFYDATDSLSYTKVSRRWTERHWRSNAFGIRDNIEYSLAIEPGKRRVSFVGDSFTAGHGIKDVESRFANRIRRAHPEWEVHVLAAEGFDTGDELKAMTATLAKGYQLDEVVLVYILNDISDLIREKARIYDVPQGGCLCRNSYLLNLLYHRLNVRRNPYLKDYYGFVREAYRGPLWATQQQRLSAYRDLVQSHGGRLSVVTFPFLHALGPTYEYQFAHDQLAQLWRKLGVPHLDLLPTYRDLPPPRLTLNRLDAHPNEYANALAADAMDKFLGQLLVSPKPSLQTNSSPRLE